MEIACREPALQDLAERGTEHATEGTREMCRIGECKSRESSSRGSEIACAKPFLKNPRSIHLHHTSTRHGSAGWRGSSRGLPPQSGAVRW